MIFFFPFGGGPLLFFLLFLLIRLVVGSLFGRRYRRSAEDEAEEQRKREESERYFRDFFNQFFGGGSSGNAGYGRYRNYQGYGGYNSGYAGGSSSSYSDFSSASLRNAYKTLGISETATDDEVKKAYRKLSLENHPDMVSGKGNEYTEYATKRFTEIQNAYELIKKERGIK